jgi:hypothetical protein
MMSDKSHLQLSGSLKYERKKVAQFSAIFRRIKAKNENLNYNLMRQAMKKLSGPVNGNWGNLLTL